jgi:hypothetical protein
MVAGTATALALVAGGCGGGGGPEAAAKDFYKAGAAGDGKKVCELLVKKQRDALNKALKASGQKGDCGEQLSKILKSSTSKSDQKKIEKAVSDGKIKSKEKGDTATVTITYKGDSQKINMKKESGDWKVDQSLTGTDPRTCNCRSAGLPLLIRGI